MYVTLLAAVSVTTTSQPNVCDTISSILCYYKVVNLMYVTPSAAVSATTN